MPQGRLGNVLISQWRRLNKFEWSCHTPSWKSWWEGQGNLLGPLHCFRPVLNFLPCSWTSCSWLLSTVFAAIASLNKDLCLTSKYEHLSACLGWKSGHCLAQQCSVGTTHFTSRTSIMINDFELVPTHGVGRDLGGHPVQTTCLE